MLVEQGSQARLAYPELGALRARMGALEWEAQVGAAWGGVGCMAAAVAAGVVCVYVGGGAALLVRGCWPTWGWLVAAVAAAALLPAWHWGPHAPLSGAGDAAVLT
jgi:hypothetical protein